MRVGGRTTIAGLWLAVAAMGCGDQPPEPPAAETEEGTSTGADESTDTGEPPPAATPPVRPDTQTCRFDGWAPGLLPPLGFEPAAVPPIEGASALTVGPEGIVLIGTAEGALWGVDPEDAEEPARPLRPGNGAPVTGLASGPSNGLDALFVRSHQPAIARTRVVRYTLDAPRELDLDSTLETFTLDHEVDGRAGAGLTLTPEGILWIGLGDGESGDYGGPADDPAERVGNLLRLDVSALSIPSGYDVPPDNPLADDGGITAEAWAWGLRDPAGCQVDGARDRVWCADRGAGVSEISLVPPSSNLGWPRLEGSDCQLPGGCDSLDTQLPLATYRYATNDCGLGPHAVADGMDDALDGAVVYGDRCSGRLFAVRPSVPGQPTARALVAQLDPVLVALAADPQGGLWAVDATGQLGRLVVLRPPGEFPTRLVDSGCFEGPGIDAPAPDLIPYELNAPLWTDGSHKQRYLVLPPHARLSVEDDGRLRFPEGAIILKNFSYPRGPFEPDRLVPAETRVMIRRSFTWEFHSYRWNDEGTEATLLHEGEARPLLTAVDGAPTIVRHTYPSREECGYCHGNGDVRALGPRLDQLARAVDYGEQLPALDQLELFDRSLPAVEPIADYHDPLVSAEDGARAYLHANCSHCHRPGGWTPPDLDMDLRWTTSTADTRICNVPPQYSSTFQAEHRISAGDPSDSLIWLRLSSRGPWQMPPFATSIPDPAALAVREWIEGLDDCPVPP